MLKKLKSLILDDTVYIAFLLVFTAIGSFGLGKMSAARPQKLVTVPEPSVMLTQSATSTSSGSATDLALKSAPSAATLTAPLDVPSEQTVVAPVRNFVASKAGTKFHALTCPGAKTIKETNKIYFASVSDAEAAGYTRAANCPPR
jgi:hypothetical protein